MTHFVLVGLDIKYADWCGWGNPAWFLASSQRASGEQPGEAQLRYILKGELHKLSFFAIIPE
jgi:hypothetical protein